MKIKVRLLRPLSDAVDGYEMEVAVPDGASVGHLIDHLCEQYPALAQNIFASTGAMVDSLVILVNGKRSDAATSLARGDEVTLLFPAGGG